MKLIDILERTSQEWDVWGYLEDTTEVFVGCLGMYSIEGLEDDILNADVLSIKNDIITIKLEGMEN